MIVDAREPAPSSGPSSGRPAPTRPPTDPPEPQPASAATATGTCTADEDLVLELREVTKEYEGTPPIRALDEVDLCVRAGELVGIVGPSGSGKSTLLNIVGALDRPTRGTVRIDGTDISSLRDSQLSGLRARSIGFVFQQFNLLSGLTALDNVADGLLYRGVAASERRARAAVALEQVGLADRTRHRPAELSGGERQRVAIARALVGEPATILADEPTGNLDSRTGQDVLALLHDLHAAGSTILLITHDHDIAEYSDRTINVRDGRVVHDGPVANKRDATEELRSMPAVEAAS
jgi:putative ABC transport system ATP-binding protein